MFAKRRARAAVVGALGLSLLLAGCTSHPVPTPSARVRQVTHPAGSTTDGCDRSRPVPGDVQPDDLVIGPLDYPGIRDGYRVAGPLPEPDAHGIRFYKIGAQLPAGKTVTVSIGSAARGYAGILTETGRSAGYSSVTYTSCAAADQKGMVFWVGGFVLAGRRTACVPLDVRVAGETTVRTARIALPAGACN